jgi:hypothetical protein
VSTVSQSTLNGGLQVAQPFAPESPRLGESRRSPRPGIRRVPRLMPGTFACWCDGAARCSTGAETQPGPACRPRHRILAATVSSQTEEGQSGSPALTARNQEPDPIDVGVPRHCLFSLIEALWAEPSPAPGDRLGDCPPARVRRARDSSAWWPTQCRDASPGRGGVSGRAFGAQICVLIPLDGLPPVGGPGSSDWCIALPGATEIPLRHSAVAVTSPTRYEILTHDLPGLRSYVSECS